MQYPQRRSMLLFASLLLEPTSGRSVTNHHHQFEVGSDGNVKTTLRKEEGGSATLERIEPYSARSSGARRVLSASLPKGEDELAIPEPSSTDFLLRESSTLEFSRPASSLLETADAILIKDVRINFSSLLSCFSTPLSTAFSWLSLFASSFRQPSFHFCFFCLFCQAGKLLFLLLHDLDSVIQDSLFA